MRFLISNRNLNTYRVCIVLIFLFLILVFFIIPLEVEKSIVLISFFAGFLIIYYVSVGRFCKIEADSIYLYYYSYKRKGRILFEDIVSVKDEAIPYTLFSKSAYGITVKYKNEQGKIKRLKFLSPETIWGGHPFQIPELKYLKSKIMKK